MLLPNGKTSYNLSASLYIHALCRKMQIKVGHLFFHSRKYNMNKLIPLLLFAYSPLLLSIIYSARTRKIF